MDEKGERSVSTWLSQPDRTLPEKIISVSRVLKGEFYDVREGSRSGKKQIRLSKH